MYIHSAACFSVEVIIELFYTVLLRYLMVDDGFWGWWCGGFLESVSSVAGGGYV